MSYRDRRQNASFKGAPFYVESTAGTQGRRVPVIELADRDGSIQQDNKRRPTFFDVEAFIAGEDFDLDRDKLEAKLTEGGPGALVLPSRGELWARVVGSIVTTEQRGEGGFCKIRFSVVLEPRVSKSLKSTPDTRGNLRKAAANVRTAAGADFGAALNAAGLPGKYLRKGVAAIGAVTSAVRSANRAIASVLNPIESASGAIDELGRATSSILSTPFALASAITGAVSSTLALADVFTNTIDRTTGLTKSSDPYGIGNSARATVRAMGKISGLGAAEDQADETLSGRDAKNARAIYRLARAEALATSAETYAGVPFDSATLALEALDGLAGEIEDLQAYDASDDLYDALSDLRAAATAHLTQTAAQLPELVKYTQRQEIPALLLAHVLYGDARRESEIVARNRLPHPGLVSGDVQVLAS